MTYYENEDVNTPSTQKEIEAPMEKRCPVPNCAVEKLAPLLSRLGSMEIGSYGLKRIVASIETHSQSLTMEAREIINFRIRRILEDNIQQWLLSGDDQVYNALDIVYGYDTVKSEILGSFNQEWFEQNRSRFLVAARSGYELAIKHNRFAVAEKIQLLFPEFVQGIPH